jgi:hypothetical protein
MACLLILTLPLFLFDCVVRSGCGKMTCCTLAVTGATVAIVRFFHNCQYDHYLFLQTLFDHIIQRFDSVFLKRCQLLCTWFVQNDIIIESVCEGGEGL